MLHKYLRKTLIIWKKKKGTNVAHVLGSKCKQIGENKIHPQLHYQEMNT